MFFPNTGSGGSSGGGGGGGTASGDYIYVGNTSSSNTSTGSSFSLGAFSIANSTLNTLSGSPFDLGIVFPSSMVITPQNTFLYIGSAATGGIFVYTINSDGSLSIGNNGSAVASGITPSVLKIDPTGNWLIALQAIGTTSNGLAYVFAINSDGTLTTQNSSAGVELDIGVPTSMVFSPNGQQAFVSLFNGGVDGLLFNASTGLLSTSQLLSPKSSGNADLGVAIDPTGTYLFVTETGSVINGSNGLRVLQVSSNAGMTELPTSPVQTDQGPNPVLVTSDGKFVYTGNLGTAGSGNGTIDGFALAPNGALTPLTGSPFTTGSGPAGLVEDNTHSYIGVVCSGGNPDLQVFQIDATTPGKLDPFASVATGTDPTLANTIVATN